QDGSRELRRRQVATRGEGTAARRRRSLDDPVDRGGPRLAEGGSDGQADGGARGPRRRPERLGELRLRGDEHLRVDSGPIKVLGLDPGTTATGFGIVTFESGRLSLEQCGVWRPPSRLAFAERLDFLLTAAVELLNDCRPVAVSVETVFAARNIASALKLSHAR